MQRNESLAGGQVKRDCSNRQRLHSDDSRRKIELARRVAAADVQSEAVQQMQSHRTRERALQVTSALFMQPTCGLSSNTTALITSDCVQTRSSWLRVQSGR